MLSARKTSLLMFLYEFFSAGVCLHRVSDRYARSSDGNESSNNGPWQSSRLGYLQWRRFSNGCNWYFYTYFTIHSPTYCINYSSNFFHLLKFVCNSFIYLALPVAEFRSYFCGFWRHDWIRPSFKELIEKWLRLGSLVFF